MRSIRIAGAFCALALAAAGCADRNPAAPPVDAPSPLSAAAAVRCTADVRAGTLACAPAGAGAGVSAALIGGQGTNVRLASSGTSYDGVGTLRSSVTVENLGQQPLGTTNGFTPSAQGVRVFFASGPQVTSGSGEVTVANADGMDAFTGSAQPFFRYDGILVPGDTSAAREWRFSVAPTVVAFSFTVYVAAEVPSEGGYVSLSPLSPSLAVGDTMRLDAAVHGVSGAVVAAAPVAWASSNPAVATIDSAGVVTAVDTGTATITATSGGRSGRVTVEVAASAPAPTIVSIDIAPRTLEAGPGDTAWMQARVRNAALSSSVTFAVGPAQCIAPRVSGTPEDGVYRCGITAPAATTGGIWAVTGVVAGNGAGLRELFYQDLVAAGAPASIYVHAAAPDVSPPKLVGFSFTPGTAVAGVDSVEVVVVAADSGVGTAQVDVTFRGPGWNQTLGCGTTAGVDEPKPHEKTFRCRVTIPGYKWPGDWQASVVLRDLNGNTGGLDSSGLAYEGFPSTLVVLNDHPDQTPPELTAFALSPDTVIATGTNPVNVFVTAEDAQAGMGFIHVQLINAAGTRTHECMSGDPPGLSLTINCQMYFNAAEAGTWHVAFVQMVDMAGNDHTVTTEELAAVPFPTTVVVKAP